MKYTRFIIALCLIALIALLFLFSVKRTDSMPTREMAHNKSLTKTPAKTPAKTFKALPREFTTAAIDHSVLMRDAKQLEKHKRVYRFAKAIDVKLTPANSGEWTQHGTCAVWQLKINSPAATSLNLGFSQYLMPEGGQLTIHAPEIESPYRAFTHADNQDHGELWTPLLSGEEMVVSVSLPAEKKDQLALCISSINHGFRPHFSRSFLKSGTAKIGGEVSGLCNIDAVCRSGDPYVNETLGPILDFYQDQIRAVAAYTLSGTDTCSGALINNTANDKKPYFLTARHCFENQTTGNFEGNPASAVFYFNFQNSYCRPRSSADSAGVGDGDTSQFMTSSSVRAHSDSSDFCLLEIDNPIPASYDVFYAGWNRNNTAATMAVGIHHPAVAEKRISVDTDTLSHSGNYWQVNDWDFGTTEGGSSGSPLFDSDGRIIGQLLGGNAACGNNLEDKYGKVFSSWTGNGSNSTRLSNWLDPLSSGATTLDGISHSPALTIANEELTEGNSGSTDMTFTVTLSESSAGTVTVDYLTSNDTATSGSDYTSSSGTLTFLTGKLEKTIDVAISGDTTAEGNESFFMTLSNPSGAIIRKDQAIGTILTDDFSTPVLSGPTSLSSSVDSSFTQQFTAANLPATFSLTGHHPAGMTIDAVSGQVQWIPTATGSFSYTVKASNSAGSDTRTVSVNVTGSDNTASATEVDLKGVGFQMDGTAWARQTSVTHDNTDALESGNINDSELSSFSITVNGPGTVSFWLRVDSEQNYDFAYFALNGETLIAKSGFVNWTQHSYNLVSGPNTLSWLYIKDFSISGGSDAAYLDEIAFEGYAAWTATHGIVSAGKFSADAEGDGAANGLEYATGLSPLIYDAQLLPMPVLDTDNLLRLTFSKPSGISGVIYDAEVSDDLIGWNTTDRSILTNNGSTFDAKQTSTPAADRKFMRLKVTPTP